jgi:hypothetical protein
MRAADFGLDLRGAVDRGGVGDPLKGEGGAGALVAQADPGATLQRVVLDDLPREERAGECPDGPQRGQLRLQTGDVDGQDALSTRDAR